MKGDIGVNIRGGKVTKQAVDAVADGIVTVFNAAHETRMDQETVRTALKILESMGQVTSTHVNNSNIRMGGS